MFDKLVFVEGPSDEEVLKHLALLLGINLARANVGFVHMAGVRNFGNFAAGKTLDLLSRRQIDMWFVLDRDERDEDDIRKMRERLGARAKLADLDRREIENFLLDPQAVLRFIHEKHQLAKTQAPAITEADVRKAIQEEAEKLKDEVVARRLAHRLLKPVFIKSGDYTVKAEESISRGVEELKNRAAQVEAARQKTIEELDRVWPQKAAEVAPGDLVLDNVAKRYAVRFNKDAGDSLRLARHLQPTSIPPSIKSILTEIGAAAD